MPENSQTHGFAKNLITELFGQIVDSYRRAEALAEVVWMSISSIAHVSGFKWPVALTLITRYDGKGRIQTDTGRSSSDNYGIP